MPDELDSLAQAHADSLAADSGTALPIEEMRRLAGLYYIFTEEEKGPEWIYKHAPYPFHKYVTFDQLNGWYRSDKWKEAREKFFDRVNRDVQLKMQRTHVNNRVQELTKLQAAFEAHLEWVLPMLNPDGSIKRYPTGDDFEGLPVLPIRPKSLNEAVTAVQTVYTLYRLSRGDATARQEHVIEGGGPDAVLKNVTISKEDAKLIAAQLLRSKQPELYEEEPLDIEIEHGKRYEE